LNEKLNERELKSREIKFFVTWGKGRTNGINSVKGRAAWVG
jgi:hypothetical protein